MKTTKKPKIVQCPRCQKTVEWTVDHPFRPFCSERCKLIDLGEWAAEKHRIEGKEVSRDADD